MTGPHSHDIDNEIIEVASQLKEAMESYGGDHEKVINLKNQYNNLLAKRSETPQSRPTKKRTGVEIAKVQAKQLWRTTGRFAKFSDNSKSKSNVIMVWTIVLFILLVPVFIFSPLFYYQYFPDNEQADRLFKKANDQYHRKEYDLSVRTYEEAIQVAPKRGDVHYRYARALKKAGYPNKSLDEYFLAAKLSPDDYKILEAAAAEYWYMNEFEKALELYLTATRVNPQNPYGYYWAGRCHEKLKQVEQAIEQYKKSTKYGPEYDGCWLAWARLLKVADKKKESETVLKNGLQHHPGNAWLHYHLGLLYAAENKNKEAIKELRRSVELDSHMGKKVTTIIAELSKGNKVVSFLCPLSQKNDSFTVRAMLNDRVPVKLLVDSGAQVCVIDPSVAKHLVLDVKSAPEIGIKGVVGSDSAKAVLLKSVSVSDARAEKIPTLIYHSELPSGAKGLLGMSYLKHFTFSLDAKHRLLELRHKKNR